MRGVMLTALLAGVSLPAMAQTIQDHIQTDPCSQLRRTTLVGVVNHPVTIKLPPGEQIYRAVQYGKVQADSSIGDGHLATDKVCGGPDGKSCREFENVFPVWPQAPGNIELTIATKKTADGENGPQSVHSFLLKVRPDEAGAMDAADVTQSLICTGIAPPAQPTPVAVRRPMQTPAAIKQRLQAEALAASTEACHYQAQGKHGSAIEPLCPVDNGQWTWMRFPGLSKKPEVLIVNDAAPAADAERPARQHVEGDFVVVEEIAAHFRLRLWPDVLDIINQAYDPVGKDPRTGTTSPHIIREVIQAKARQ